MRYSFDFSRMHLEDNLRVLAIAEQVKLRPPTAAELLEVVRIANRTTEANLLELPFTALSDVIAQFYTALGAHFQAQSPSAAADPSDATVRRLLDQINLDEDAL